MGTKSPVKQTGNIDRSVMTCDAKSQPTFCEAPDASIDCFMLQDKMNKCTDLASPSAEFVVYDPYNCGAADGVAPIAGCNFDQGAVYGYCRECGVGISPLELCATGFYKEFYGPRLGQKRRNSNERSGKQAITDLLGLPIQIDCDKFYDDIETIEKDALEASASG